MPTTLIASLLVSSFAIAAPTASVIASVATVAIGIGFSLIASLLNKSNGPKPSDGQVTINSSAAPRSRSYGRVKRSGNLMFANTSGGYFGRIYAMNAGPIDAVEEHWLDDNEVTLSGEQVTSDPYVVDGASRAFINWRLGEDTPAVYAATHTTFPDLWTEDHLGRRIASAELVLHQTPSKSFTDTFPKGGDTLYRQVQRASLVPDISATGAWLEPTWSGNAARVILDYLTHPDGLRLDPSWILAEWQSWYNAIQICDELVTLADGGTEARYRIWNTYTFDERPADVLNRFLAACDGVVYPTPNRGIAIYVGKWIPPTVTIDDNAVLGFTSFGRGRDILTTANTVRAQFTNPLDDYQQTDADIWLDSVDIGIRGEIAVDMEFFPAPSHSQCRRLMKLAAYRANPNWVGTITCNLRALPAMGQRFVTVQIFEIGVNETFEILSSQLMIDDTIVTGIEIQVQSMPYWAYDWTTIEEGTPPPIPEEEDGRMRRITPERDLPPLTAFDATANGLYAVLRWDPLPSDSLTADIEYQVTSEAQWSAWPVADGATAARLGPLTLGTQYAFRARTRSELTDRVSDWTPVDYITIGTEDWVLVADALAATVDLDFADDLYFQRDRSATLAALVTVARSAVGYADDKAGVWTSFAPNTPRRTNRGLLVEEARSNYVRNNSMQGAVAGTPGTVPTNWTVVVGPGLTRSVVGTGTIAGIEYVDIRITGTATTASAIQIFTESNTAVAPAVVGQTWTYSSFVALAGGSFPAGTTARFVRHQEFNASATLLIDGTAQFTAPTATITRTSYARTTTQPTVASVRVLEYYNYLNGVVIDVTLRIGWPQLELGAFASSPIRTTGAVATRGTEIVTLTAPPALGSGYTLYAQGAPAINGADQAYASLNDGSVANSFSLRRTAGNATARLSAGGSTVDLTSGAMAIGAATKLAAAYQSGSQALSRNGAAVAAGASALVPTGINTLSIGHGAIGTAPWNGYVERVAVWPANRISNAGLQTLTT